MTTLQNEIFTLTFNEKEGWFSIEPKDKKFPAITHAFLGMKYRTKSQWISPKFTNWREIPSSRQMQDFGVHGKTEMIRYEVKTTDGLVANFCFGIVQETPLVVWKIEVLNERQLPARLEKIDLLKVKESAGGKVIYPEAANSSEIGFYSNGWQSWSPTGWYAADGKMKLSKLRGLQTPMINNPGTPMPKKKGQFSSDMFAVVGDRTARTGFVVGFLSQKEQFGTIAADFNRPGWLAMWANCDEVRLDPGKTISTDWAVFNPVLLDHRDPLDKYLEAVARENDVKVPAESPVGWCSWYHFYTHLSEKDVQANLKTILEQQEILPIQLAQIDDGFESQIGDWFSFKPEFPNGVKPLAEEISREGLIPGLWLAPFIVHPRSQVAKNHPDWLLRQKNGRLANAGFVWNVLDTALDLTVPEALAYACSVVRTASKDWGYPYLKLDFLYAAALKGRYKDPTVTRAQVLRKGMEALRAAVGRDVTILGCGAPLGSMLGLIEANRIGADVSGDWEPNFNGIGAFFRNEPAMPCARNSIRNILTRAALHQHWWINDPDCLLIRPDTKLTLPEVESLASAIALTGGSLLVSDDLPQLPPERLRIAEVLLPVIGERARVIDWFDAEMPEMLRLDQLNAAGERHVLAKFNWSDNEITFDLIPEGYHLPSGDYWVREFWSGKTGMMSAAQPFSVTIPPHGCAVVTLQVKDAKPAYLGSDLHISQGMELVSWNVDDKTIKATLRLPRKTSGHILIATNGKAESVTVNDRKVEGKVISPGIFEVPVDVDGFATIEVKIK
jgi:alpha-galactosidase